jgi:hypothetical protein
MRTALLETLVPVLSTVLVALAGWVAAQVRVYLARRTIAADRESLRLTAAAVVADLAAHVVEDAKGGGGDGWTAERQAEVRSAAVARVKALEPLAVAALLPALGAARLDELVGVLVEQAVARAKRPAG